MKTKEERFLKAQEFAKRAGVTVRTLHYYDHLGLLRPTSYTRAGYRLYSEKSFARLQQIATLKFIGFSLTEIKKLINRDSFDLADALQVQKKILKEKRRQLDAAVLAIEKAEQTLKTNEETDWEAFAKIVEVINMQNEKEWMMKYYSAEARQKIQERQKLWTPELQEQVTRDWNNLFADIKDAAAKGEDPATERAQSFVKRWDELISRFTGDDPEVKEGLNKLYADQENWPSVSNFKRPWTDDVDTYTCCERGV